MPTLNVHIPYEKIARIAPVMSEAGEDIIQVAKRVKCDYIINGGTYDLDDPTKLDSGLKIDKDFVNARETHGLGIREDGRLEWSYGGKWTPSWIGYYSVGKAPDGKLHGRHIPYYQQRTGMGYTDDGIVLAATTDKVTTATFARKHLAQCKSWINLDGGGSTQWITPSGRYISGRKVVWYVCVWLVKDEDNNGGDDRMITNLPLGGEITMTAGFGEVNTALWSGAHKGIDLVAADKTIYSPCEGKVRVVAYDAAGWGQYVTIGSADGKYVHVLAHMVKGSVLVKTGQQVTRTTKIGTMGATGKCTGVHLHYQINTLANKAVDPSFWTHLPNKRGTYQASDYAVDKDGKLLAAAPPSEPQPTTPATGDNTPDAWAKDAVERAVKAGVLVGDDKGDLKLHSAVTRQELAVILARAKVI